MTSLRSCLEPGCRVLTRGQSRCPEHTKAAWSRRPARPDLQTAAWRKLSKRRRAMYPICEIPGCQRPSVQTDHIVRPDDGGTNEWSNLRAICRLHHGQKTAHEGHVAQARKRKGK